MPSFHFASLSHERHSPGSAVVPPSLRGVDLRESSLRGRRPYLSPSSIVAVLKGYEAEVKAQGEMIRQICRLSQHKSENRQRASIKVIQKRH